MSDLELYLRGLFYRIACLLSLPLMLLVPLVVIIDIIIWIIIGDDDWKWVLVIDWYIVNILHRILGD